MFENVIDWKKERNWWWDFLCAAMGGEGVWLISTWINLSVLSFHQSFFLQQCIENYFELKKKKIQKFQFLSESKISRELWLMMMTFYWIDWLPLITWLFKYCKSTRHLPFPALFSRRSVQALYNKQMKERWKKFNESCLIIVNLMKILYFLDKLRGFISISFIYYYTSFFLLLRGFFFLFYYFYSLTVSLNQKEDEMKKKMFNWKIRNIINFRIFLLIKRSRKIIILFISAIFYYTNLWFGWGLELCAVRIGSPLYESFLKLSIFVVSFCKSLSIF